MTEVIDSRVTLSLHPGVVRNIKDYNDETAPFVASAESAFAMAYQTIGTVHDAKKAALSNPTWNEAKRLIETDTFARKQEEKIGKAFEVSRRNLIAGVAVVEGELNALLGNKVATPVASEIRSFVKNLSETKRQEFMASAVQELDEATLGAVLGTLPYLSGLNPVLHKHYLQAYQERKVPHLAKRLAAMKAAVELYNNHWPKISVEIQKAVGASYHEVKKLREAKARSEKAFS